MSLSRIPSIHTPRLAPRTCSPCFRTDAAGRIPLGGDWRKLFHVVSRLETVAIQSRHAFARLVYLGRLPVLTWDDAGLLASDEAGALRLRCAGWGRAWGRIALCPCCDSPGIIEVHNRHGGEFLQFCALPDSNPTDWANCLAGLASAAFTPDVPQGRAATGFSILPKGTRQLAATGMALPAFFSAIGAESVRLRVLLPTPELTHLRELTPRYVSTEQPLLTLSDMRVTLQLALPKVRAIRLARDGSLHVAGPDGVLLVSFAPLDPEGTEAWRTTLKAYFPAAHQTFFTP